MFAPHICLYCLENICKGCQSSTTKSNFQFERTNHGHQKKLRLGETEHLNASPNSEAQSPCTLLVIQRMVLRFGNAIYGVVYQMSRDQFTQSTDSPRQQTK